MAGRKVATYWQEDELVIWEVLGHLVSYQRLEHKRIVQIAAIRPD